MPSDDWRKDRDRQHQRTARREIAEFGHLRTYEPLHDASDQRSDEPDALINLLNELREKIPPQFKVQIPEFTILPTNDDRSSILLIVRLLESGIDVNLVFLAVIVEQIGLPAIDELRRLISTEKYVIIVRALKLLQEVDKSLACLAEKEIRDAADFLQPDVQSEGRATLRHIGIYFQKKAQPEELLGKWKREDVVEEVEFTADGTLLRNNRFAGEFKCTDNGDIQVWHNRRIAVKWKMGDTSLDRLVLTSPDGVVAVYNRAKAPSWQQTKKKTRRTNFKK